MYICLDYIIGTRVFTNSYGATARTGRARLISSIAFIASGLQVSESSRVPTSLVVRFTIRSRAAQSNKKVDLLSLKDSKIRAQYREQLKAKLIGVMRRVLVLMKSLSNCSKTVLKLFKNYTI